MTNIAIENCPDKILSFPINSIVIFQFANCECWPMAIYSEVSNSKWWFSSSQAANVDPWPFTVCKMVILHFANWDLVDQMAIYSEFSHSKWWLSIVMSTFTGKIPSKSHETIIFLWFSYGFPMVFPPTHHQHVPMAPPWVGWAPRRRPTRPPPAARPAAPGAAPAAAARRRRHPWGPSHWDFRGKTSGKWWFNGGLMGCYGILLDFMGFNGVFCWIYPLVNFYRLRTAKIHHAMNGKTHNWAIFNSEMLN